MTPSPGTTWLLFDGDCRVCSAAARWVRIVDIRGHVRAQPIQESQALLESVPPDRRLDAVRALAPDGRLVEGADAFPVILAALSGGPPLEGLLRSSPQAMFALSRCYDALVKLRGRLTCGVAASA